MISEVASSFAHYSARTENTHVKHDWIQVSHSIRQAQKRTCQARLPHNLGVVLFGIVLDSAFYMPAPPLPHKEVDEIL